jgi:para-aminobenzoate synthetase
MDNFLKSCNKRREDDTSKWIAPPRIIRPPQHATADAPLHVYHVSTRSLIGMGISTDRVFETLYHQNASIPAIWLDSSLQLQQQQQQQHDDNDDSDNMTRYSILAGMTGPLSRRIDYYGQEHADCERRGVCVTRCDGTMEWDESVEDILDYLDRQHKNVELIHNVDDDDDDDDDDEPLDLPFVGGHLGYLGYEVRHDTQRKLDHLEVDDLPPARSNSPPSTAGPTNPHVPTAAFLFCDQSLVYDHWKDTWHLIELTTPTSPPTDWLSITEQTLRSLSTVTTAPEPPPPPFDKPLAKSALPLHFVPNRSRSAYQADIANCHEQIRLGESYELCLTNQLEAAIPTLSDGTPLDPYQLYKILRSRNPAPFAGYVNFQGTTTTKGQSAPLTICCSSPERFVSVRPSPENTNEFVVEAKPIKGTAPRYHSSHCSNESDTIDAAAAHELQTSVKNRAENLMIVDLLRNDLNRVCKTGTVHVPKLMAIESYATVHQLVSTIRGVLEPHKTPLDVLTACFPGGSMTGAPKRRTVELLHEMEDGVSRGPYAGCLGYLSLNGRMDMNIVIRSIVVTPLTGDDGWNVSIGAGGAITALSESDDEYEEMLLKARAVKEAVEMWVSSATGRDSHHDSNPAAEAAESLLELNVELPK